MSAVVNSGRADALSTVWLRRWQVEEEGLIVHVADAIDWRCVRPSREAVDLAAAAGVTLTAELDTYADGIASVVFHSVQGLVTRVQEVWIDGDQTNLISTVGVLASEAVDLVTAPGFVVTVRQRFA